MLTYEKARRWFLGLPQRLWAMCLLFFMLSLTLLVVYCTTNVIRVTSSNAVVRTVIACDWSPAPALAAAGVEKGEQDIVVTDIAADGTLFMHVEHAVEITLTADGQTRTLLAVPSTIENALSSLGISVGALDYTEPALSEVFSQGHNTDITLYRVTYEEYLTDAIVPYTTEYQYTSLFYRTPDYTLTMQEGADGYAHALMRDVLVDGVVQESIVLEDYGSVAAVPEIIKVYQEQVPISNLEAPEGITVEDFVPSSYTTVYSMKATGYSSSSGKGASGLGLYYGTFAVDPSVIPYGTKVYIVSEDASFVYGWAIATDTGAFINTNQMQVDLFYETYAESVKNAVQQVYVYVP